MKSIRKYMVIVAGCALFFGACEKLNDNHQKFMKDGEIVYIGRVDSMRVLPGEERVVFRYWLADPRARSLTATWSNGKESLMIEIPPHQPIDSFEVQIGKNEKTLTEGDYTFHWVTRDDKGNKSVVFEQIAKVYGERYKRTLSDRIIVNTQTAGNNVTVTWGTSISDQEVGVTVKYTTQAGETKILHYTTEDLTGETVEGLTGPIIELVSTVMTNVNLSVPPQYLTKFLPVPLAVDTFYTDFRNILP